MRENQVRVIKALLTVSLLLVSVLVFDWLGETGGIRGINDKTETRKVYLYYYNLSRDREISGSNDVLCSRQAVLPVEREVPLTNNLMAETIDKLLQGVLTPEEKAQGFSTEFPGKEFQLVKADLSNHVLTLQFSDPANFSIGGSCRVQLLWAQIEKTGKQFPGVLEVRFVPEDLFQP